MDGENEMYGTWKGVPGVEGLFVSSNGWVKSDNGYRLDSMIPFNPSQGISGYRRFKHRGVEYAVHRIVCLTFHGDAPSESHTVDHIQKYSGDFLKERGDNRACNLRWATGTEQNLNKKKESKPRNGKGVVIKHSDWDDYTPLLQFHSLLDTAKFLGYEKSSSNVSKAISKNWKLRNFSLQWAIPNEVQVDFHGEEWIKVDERTYVSSMGRAQIRDNIGDGWGNRFTPKITHARDYARLRDKFFHVLVAVAFLGEKPSEKHSVDHINRDKSDNRLCNLRWATHSEQQLNKDKVSRSSRICKKVIALLPGHTTWTTYKSRSYACKDIFKRFGIKLSPGSVTVTAQRRSKYKGIPFRNENDI